MRLRPEETLLPEGEVELPARFGLGPLLEVGVDGAPPVTFLLDTGFGVCVLDAVFAARLTSPIVPIRGEAAIVGTAQDEVPLTTAVRLGSLVCGELELRGLDAAVVDLSGLAAAHGVELAGILGFPAFFDCLLTLDWPGGSVRVGREGLGPVDGETILPLAPSETPWVVATLGERTLELHVDSGSNETLALPRELTGLEWAFGPIPFSKVTTVTGMQERIPFGRLAGELRLGRYVLRRPIVNLTPSNARLGAGLLRRFVTSFDQRGRRVRLLREGNVLEFPAWRGHGAGFLPQGEHEVVADVVPGSPAEAAGLAEGTLVLERRREPFDDLQGAVVPAGFEGEFLLVEMGGTRRVFALPYVELIP